LAFPLAASNGVILLEQLDNNKDTATKNRIRNPNTPNCLLFMVFDLFVQIYHNSARLKNLFKPYPLASVWIDGANQKVEIRDKSINVRGFEDVLTCNLCVVFYYLFIYSSIERKRGM
jgi:hypothetical protein